MKQHGSQVYNCPEQVRGEKCCLGGSWRVFCRPVCDGVETYCAVDSEDMPAEDLATRYGTPEAMEGY